LELSPECRESVTDTLRKKSTIKIVTAVGEKCSVLGSWTGRKMLINKAKRENGKCLPGWGVGVRPEVTPRGVPPPNGWVVVQKESQVLVQKMGGRKDWLNV